MSESKQKRRPHRWTHRDFAVSLGYYLLHGKNATSLENETGIRLSKKMGISINSLSLRVANYISCDPKAESKGLNGRPKGDDGQGHRRCQPWFDAAKSSSEVEKAFVRLTEHEIGRSVLTHDDLESTIEIIEKSVKIEGGVDIEAIG
ncbi:hypothetical protein [Thioalkalivibrio sp. HK1]|uniref:hypothetical protein n=1 Tax=Thioalkalivibrio sp. HK1 TaxID=1469245 RepID=UPI00046E9D39|nr:hypothetical protein [Thioalkalivibrio sp. HK1]